MKKFAMLGFLSLAIAGYAGEAGTEFFRGLALLKKGEYAAAAKIIQPLAEKGDLNAKKQFALMKYYGKGVPRDQAEAYKIFNEIFAASKDKESAYYLGIMQVYQKYDEEKVARGIELLKYAAEPEGNDPGFAKAQFVMAKARLENYDFSQFRYYMELAAAQGLFEAWMALGKHYAQYIWSTNYTLWAKYCFDAALKIDPTAEAEYHAGMIAVRLKEFERAARLLQSASEKGNKPAAEFLASNKLTGMIKKHVSLQASLQHQPAAQRAFFNTGSHKMLLLPLDPAVKMAGWEFRTNRERLNYDNAMQTGLVNAPHFFLTEDFISQPLRKNISNRETALLMLNEKYYPGFLAFLEKSAFARCSDREKNDLITFFRTGRPHLTLKYFADDHFFKLREDLFFHIHEEEELGNQYQFIIRKDGKFSRLLSFDTPPDREDAAMISGMLAGDPAALNNAAIYLAAGNKSPRISGDALRAEEILQQLAARKHAVGTYNLAMFYQNRSKYAEAEKYFLMAEKFAGSSVISYQIQRPEIFDRNGKLLVKNRFYLPSIKSRSRVYLQDGCFAGNLLGHTSAGEESSRDGDTGRQCEAGMGGIEQLIDDNFFCRPLYLTIDTELQLQLDKFITGLAAADPLYTSAAVLSSDGELIAASQTPCFDVKKRKTITLSPSAEKWLFAFIPASFTFPVPDQWMKLLGSSSYDTPENKERFQFHTRQRNPFPAESAGWVPGLNCRMNEDRRTLSGQSANMLKFLSAYISETEKIPMPEIKYFTFEVNSPVKVDGNIRWISFYRPPDGIVVNALGTIKSASGKKLYIFVRFVPMERKYGKKVPAEAIKAAAKKADDAEKIIRKFNFNGKK